VNAVTGVATFTGLSIDLPSPGYILAATSGTLTGESTAFSVAQPPFTAADIAKALRWAAGLAIPAPIDAYTHDVVKSGASAGVLEVLDACRIARKVSGLEPNP